MNNSAKNAKTNNANIRRRLSNSNYPNVATWQAALNAASGTISMRSPITLEQFIKTYYKGSNSGVGSVNTDTIRLLGDPQEDGYASFVILVKLPGRGNSNVSVPSRYFILSEYDLFQDHGVLDSLTVPVTAEVPRDYLDFKNISLTPQQAYQVAMIAYSWLPPLAHIIKELDFYILLKEEKAQTKNASKYPQVWERFKTYGDEIDRCRIVLEKLLNM